MTEIYKKDTQGIEPDAQGEPIAQTSGNLANEYTTYLVKLGVCQEDAERQARYLTDPDALAHRSDIERTINPSNPDVSTASSRIPAYRATTASLIVTGERAVQEAAAALQTYQPTEPKPASVKSNSAGAQTVFVFRRGR